VRVAATQIAHEGLDSWLARVVAHGRTTKSAGRCGLVLHDPGSRAGRNWGTVVSRTPAADLARLKVQHPGWVIRRRMVPGQPAGYTAHRKFRRGGFQSLHTVTLGGLEQALLLAERGMLDEAGARRRRPSQRQG